MDTVDVNLLPPAAQTNLALYRQLHALDYSHADLIRVRDGYELATLLFAGHLRGSGKPFLAHLVGTASILAAIGAPQPTVAAGLLHAAYQQGDFGVARWRQRRKRVRAAIGDDAEAIVWRYNAMPWTCPEIDRLYSDLDRLPPVDRSVLVVRLANELEDQLDLAMLFCHPERDVYRDRRDTFIAMAKSIGSPSLASTLMATYREASGSDWATALSLNRPQSFQVASSFGLKLLIPARKLEGFVRKIIAM